MVTCLVQESAQPFGEWQIEEGRFAEIIRELKDECGSLRAIERRTHVATSHLSYLASGFTKPGYESVRRLADAFPERATELYLAAGIPPPMPPGIAPEVWAEILTVAREASESKGLPLDEVLRDMARQYAPR